MFFLSAIYAKYGPLISKAVKNNKIVVNSENLIIKTAKETIKIEEETLSALGKAIGQNFQACIESIALCDGRIVVSGIGKSALVAQKIVATLNSTGTPSIFMHAADAIHGDLGMIRQEDFVLCISKSGETAEIRVLASLVKKSGNTLIAMVSNPDSYLAKRANFTLFTPVAKEADPHNLAPTASTTSQMAMGDAIATSLLALRGFTAKDFAQFHPGGSLGKQLYLRVCDLFPQNEKPLVYLDDSIEKTILEMTTKRLGATAVLDRAGTLQGIITDGDLRRMLNRHSDISQLIAQQVMTKAPMVIHKDEMAVKALHKIQQKSITQLIVVDQPNEYLGMIHLHDLIREGLV